MEMIPQGIKGKFELAIFVIILFQKKQYHTTYTRTIYLTYTNHTVKYEY